MPSWFFWLISFIGCTVALHLRLPTPKPIDPDCYRRAVELITSKGYPVEEHNVTTEDGYILTMQRIPYGRGQLPGPREAILLQHGLEGCSTNFIDNYAPSQNLGFFLANAGYDVWLANSRGNSYSLGHVKYSINDHNYWKFSWDQMAKYDLPAMIDKVLAETKHSQIYYLGHSQGTLIAFAEFSQNPDIAKKVIAQWLGIDEFKPNKGLIDKMTEFACSQNGDQFAYLCENIEFLLYGHNASLWNITRIPVYLCHNPDSTSAQNMAHFGQMVTTNRMQMFDYGPILDFVYYGKDKPPVYNPSKLTIPTVLFTGGQDKLADPEDVNWLEGLFTNTHTIEAIYNIPNYGHLDFIFAMDAPKKVYGPILTHMRK